ncbi:MAG: hypothetical protein P4L84_04420 [Isosphaeraceae bacterium]|nr:hypothetical protein [Isosphaeraceae bacterium]
MVIFPAFNIPLNASVAANPRERPCGAVRRSQVQRLVPVRRVPNDSEYLTLGSSGRRSPLRLSAIGLVGADGSVANIVTNL